MEEMHRVFGTGPVGMSVVDELLARGKRVRLASRSGKARETLAGVEVVAADAADPASTRQACQGATHVYNCVNAPDYHRWPEQFPPLQAGIIEGAAAAGARLIVMENLYMYGPHGGTPMTEDLPMNGTGSRCSTRKQMTIDLFEAHRSGKVRVTSGRASDFFGPRVTQSFAGADVFRSAMAGKPVRVNGDPALPHSYTYIKDIGKALVILGQHDEALGQAWHIPKSPTISTRQFLSQVFEAAGNPPRITATSRGMAAFMLPLLALVTPQLKGLEENFWQMYEPFIVDHGKFDKAFDGELQATQLRDSIHATQQWYRTHHQ